MGDEIRVLVVDDSAFMRKVISDFIQQEPDLVLVGTARDGQDALEKVAALKPHVVTLDVEMPRMDGLAALREMVRRFQVAVVMVSSLTQEGAETTIKALALGAVDFVGKPSGSISLDMDKVRNDLLHKVRLAARAKVGHRKLPLHLAPRNKKPALPAPAGPAADRLVVIGCSTGGPGALHQVIPRLPAQLAAGVIVVQHMPPGFTRSLATRLDELSSLSVREAADGDVIAPGVVYVAPGGAHLLVEKDGRLSINHDPPLHGVRPAVDKTLEAAVRIYGSRCLGVIMTGMGYDGAKGVMELKKAGGRVIAEHESTCVVYGMPKVVVEMGNADRVVPVTEIAAAVVELLP